MIIFYCLQGAGFGLAIGFALPTWIYIGSQIYPTPTAFMGLKSLSVSNCTSVMDISNVTTTTSDGTTLIDATTSAVTTNLPDVADRPAIADLYAVSYAYYAAIGFGASIIVGLIVSFITREAITIMLNLLSDILAFTDMYNVKLDGRSNLAHTDFLNKPVS